MVLASGCDARAGFERHRWTNQQDDAKPHAIQQVGPNRVRFEVRGGDTWKKDAKFNRNRAELSSRTRHAPGEDVWFSYQLVVRGGEPTRARFNILGQFHQTKDPWDKNLSPPFAINLLPKKNTLRFIKRYSAEQKTTTTTDTIMHESAPIQRDRWIHVVGHIVFGWENNGAVELWLDGRKVVDLPRTSIGYNDALGPYWKFGIYRAGSPEPLVVEYANLEIGSASLLGRVGKPLPVG
ncbi:MAG TPA: heparin lyase I family protein [Caulobacteraceae bacterium]|nr:heparin lyase I family protein [Caulobacteraceae bacterium]